MNVNQLVTIGLTLFTVLSTSVACLAAWVSYRWANEAAAESMAITKSKVNIALNEATIENVSTQLKKLRGDVYRMRAENGTYEAIPKEPPAPETPDQVRNRLRAEHGLPNIRGNSSAE